MDGDPSVRLDDALLLSGGEVLAPATPLRVRMLRLIVVVGVVTIGTSFQFGFGTGALNNLEQVAPATLAASGMPMTLWQWSLVVSGFGLGGLLGSLAVVHVSLRFGRKTVLLATNMFVLMSSALMMTGTTWPVLFIGRVCIGLVAGIGSAVVPMYLAEIAPTAVRGAVGTAHQLGITLGCLTSFALTTPSLRLLGGADTWRYVFLVPVCCSLLQCLVLPFCPEVRRSPRTETHRLQHACDATSAVMLHKEPNTSHAPPLPLPMMLVSQLMRLAPELRALRGSLSRNGPVGALRSRHRTSTAP